MHGIESSDSRTGLCSLACGTRRGPLRRGWSNHLSALIIHGEIPIDEICDGAAQTGLLIEGRLALWQLLGNWDVECNLE